MGTDGTQGGAGWQCPQIQAAQGWAQRWRTHAQHQPAAPAVQAAAWHGAVQRRSTHPEVVAVQMKRMLLHPGAIHSAVPRVVAIVCVGRQVLEDHLQHTHTAQHGRAAQASSICTPPRPLRTAPLWQLFERPLSPQARPRPTERQRTSGALGTHLHHLAALYGDDVRAGGGVDRRRLILLALVGGGGHKHVDATLAGGRRLAAQRARVEAGLVVLCGGHQVLLNPFWIAARGAGRRAGGRCGDGGGGGDFHVPPGAAGPGHPAPFLRPPPPPSPVSLHPPHTPPPLLLPRPTPLPAHSLVHEVQQGLAGRQVLPCHVVDCPPDLARLPQHRLRDVELEVDRGRGHLQAEGKQAAVDALWFDRWTQGKTENIRAGASAHASHHTVSHRYDGIIPDTAIDALLGRHQLAAGDNHGSLHQQGRVRARFV